MKAIVRDRYGPPDVLHLEDIPKPEPQHNHVLVRVRATSVNDWDWSYVRGKPTIYRLMFGLTKPRVTVLGAEVAGVVESIGHGATRFQPGDRVYGDISDTGFGGFAEYVSVREDALYHMSPSMTFEQAAALPHASMLAYQGLVDVGHIQKGDRLLINGAGGGVGIIGVQIATRYGSEVTGVDAGFKLDTLRAFGFDHVIDYREVDFTRTGEQYDLVLDAKTTRSPFAYLRALKPGGRYVTVGGTVPRLLQTVFLGPLLSRFSGGRRLRLLALKPNTDLATINDLFETGGLKLAIDGPYPLGEVPRAVQRFGEARHIGKVVIRVA
jgi:NADPH:quinone reductase-like Zn-dependent oxidoreductase